VDAEIMFVGEQPGDREDREGHPFVGPAGQLLDKALVEAAVDRERVYVTNAVKHFKFEPRGKRRLHKRPNAGEIKICRRWLFDEIEAVGPPLIVALGATLHRVLPDERSQFMFMPIAARSSILRTDCRS
jgi:uracil-DNA glycosylase